MGGKGQRGDGFKGGEGEQCQRGEHWASEVAEEAASQIMALNSELKVPIHCICFVSDGSADMMKVIAQKSGGTYTFVPGPRP